MICNDRDLALQAMDPRFIVLPDSKDRPYIINVFGTYNADELCFHHVFTMDVAFPGSMVDSRAVCYPGTESTADIYYHFKKNTTDGYTGSIGLVQFYASSSIGEFQGFSGSVINFEIADTMSVSVTGIPVETYHTVTMNIKGGR